jgi:membrane protease YdiL (CAAX protease family)
METVEINRNRWRVLCRVLVFMLACAVVLAAVAPLAARLPGEWAPLATGATTSFCALLLTALFARWDGLRLAAVIGTLEARSAGRLLAGFVIGTVLVTLWAFVLRITGQVQWVRTPLPRLSACAVTIVVYLVLASREELGFHGYPLKRLNDHFGLWQAQLIVALVFAAEHKLGGFSWADALLSAGIASLLFGIAAIATKGLGVPIGLHAAWNFGQWAFGMRGSPGFLKAVVPQNGEGAAHQAGTLTSVAIMSSATAAIWLWHRRRLVIRAKQVER